MRKKVLIFTLVMLLLIRPQLIAFAARLFVHRSYPMVIVGGELPADKPLPSEETSPVPSESEAPVLDQSASETETPLPDSDPSEAPASEEPSPETETPLPDSDPSEAPAPEEPAPETETPLPDSDPSEAPVPEEPAPDPAESEEEEGDEEHEIDDSGTFSDVEETRSPSSARIILRAKGKIISLKR